MVQHRFQENAKVAWIYMGIYWGLSAICNQRYFEKLALLPTVSHGVAFLTTILCQRCFNDRFSRYGRPQSRIVCLLFAIWNGIFETFWFLRMYDFGRVDLKERFALSDASAIALGWSLYYIYSAVIHVGFWLPLVFPYHTKSTAPPFHLHGLPLLTILSLSWFFLYEWYDDSVAFVCCLHMIIDGWAAWNIGLPGPFCSTNHHANTKQTKEQ